MLYQLSYVRVRATTIPPAPVAANGSSEGCPNGVPSDDDSEQIGRAAAAATRRLAGGVCLGLRQATRREEGQTMTEYAVVLGVITPCSSCALHDAVRRAVARITTLIGFLT